jgi:Tfp pilus assembly protein PilF
VTLTNAAEVALSRLRVDQAESLIDRATRYPNPSSVSNPWIQKLYLTLAQSRFDDAQSALEQMLIWRNRQDPLIGVSNRAEHFLASAAFLLIAGYTEDAARLAESALNQPDRNGNFSADDAQKDAIAALLTTLALRADYERQLEYASAQEWQLRLSSVAKAQLTRLAAWRAGRRAASLFANAETMRDRLRPYAPLDVHIPEWMEPEIAKLLGAGVFDLLIDDAEIRGSFRGAPGYKHAFVTETAALQKEFDRVISEGTLALSLLPSVEVLLRARVQWHLAQAYWSKGDTLAARSLLSTSLRQDPSLARRLGGNIPVALSHDGSDLALALAAKLTVSPRFDAIPEGLALEIAATSLCLRDGEGAVLSCYTPAPNALDPAEIVVEFQRQLFGVGVDLSKAQLSALMGASVVLRSQSYGSENALPNF